MNITKSEIINNICYTDLVYERVNKKLRKKLTNKQIEEFVIHILEETPEKLYLKKGKNYYIANPDQGIRLTVNSNTYRLITVDII
ncbi:MAG: DUF3781 domain-containing protein [Bacteroidetes bacterium]|nr:DUF3781 domain-containing protein [Bacteroidota bacterium]